MMAHGRNIAMWPESAKKQNMLRTNAGFVLPVFFSILGMVTDPQDFTVS